MHVGGHTAAYTKNTTHRSSVTANMHLIGERYFLYRYRIFIVCSVTGLMQNTSCDAMRCDALCSPALDAIEDE